MGKQFDLEQQILACWNVTSDLDVLLENVIENDSLTKDNISNVVLGMQELYELKFDKCFRTFEEFLKEYYGVKKELQALQATVADVSTNSPFGTDEVFGDVFATAADTWAGSQEYDQVDDIREQYHEELSGMSDDEIVRTVREQYIKGPSAFNVNVNYEK